MSYETYLQRVFLIWLETFFTKFYELGDINSIITRIYHFYCKQKLEEEF